jgi:hypothetical protein
LIMGNGIIAARVPLIWQVTGVNWDGKADILWRNTGTGALTYWTMKGVRQVGAGFFQPPSVPIAWQLGGVF